jgi:outer membrane lipoprotein SlyB
MSFEKILPIWWSFAWRGCVVGGLVGALLGAVSGGVAGLTGHAEIASMVGALMGYLGSIPVSIWALREALNLHRLEKATEV